MRACTCMNACKFQKGPPATFFILPFCVTVQKIGSLRRICTNGGILASVALDYNGVFVIYVIVFVIVLDCM